MSLTNERNRFSRCSCARRLEAYLYACADSCEYTVFLLVCTHVGGKHTSQSKQSCHWWEATTLKVLVLPCPCLHQELLITCLPQHREWDTGRARTRRQHELSPANNFDMLPCCRFRKVAPRASRRCAVPQLMARWGMAQVKM